MAVKNDQIQGGSYLFDIGYDPKNHKKTTIQPQPPPEPVTRKLPQTSAFLTNLSLYHLRLCFVWPSKKI